MADVTDMPPASAAQTPPPEGEEIALDDDYLALLKAKVRMAPSSGIELSTGDFRARSHATPHVPFSVQWAARGGRRAIFAAFGLHKTAMQLELMRLLRQATGGLSLIVCPLGVRDQFVEEAAALDEPVHWIRQTSDAQAGVTNLTNYEPVRDGAVDPRAFRHASLDEASVLRSFGSKTFQTFLPMFSETPFRFVATATPSPNRYKELIHYAGYLGVMDTGQALTRFFQRNSQKAGDLTLYPHKEHEFWLWVASWALFIQRPSDLGFSDDGYEMPPLEVRWHEVPSLAPWQVREAEEDGHGGHGKHGQSAGDFRDLRAFRGPPEGPVAQDAPSTPQPSPGLKARSPSPASAGGGGDRTPSMFPERVTGLAEAAREKRGSIASRVAKTCEIVAAAPDDHFVLWHDLEDERAAIEAALPTAVSVYGTQELEAREDAVRQFSAGWLQYLASKPVLLGSGTNLQKHCHRAVFTGVGFKFNDFIQAIYRLQRFGQARQVEIDIVHTEAEREVVRELMDKWARDTELRARMSALIREYGMNELAMAETLQRKLGVERLEASSVSGKWRVAHNDCVLEARRMADDSIDLVVTSIPFSNHYEYTPQYEDFGHTENNAHFFEQLDHLTVELKRVLKPGRLACVHVKDRILFGSVTGEGVPTVDPFHADCIYHYRRHGFQYLGMHEVLTDVVRENNQTYRLGYTEMCKDSTKMGCGSSEFVLLVRKPQSNRGWGYADAPVTRAKADYSLARWQTDAHAFWRSSGDRLIAPEEAAALAQTEGGMAKLMGLWGEESLTRVYDYRAHVRIGEAMEQVGRLPATFMALAPRSWSDRLWSDVNRMRTLNTAQASAGREKHICPLQFDIVDRLIERYSMAGELVFDPFCGLGTVPLRAMALGRRGCGAELNADYWRDSVTFLQAAEAGEDPPSLFDLLDAEGA